MKKLKNILSIILVAIIILTATSTMAYSGTLDVGHDIEIETTISEGKGSIKIANGMTGYNLYYQTNEIDNDTYKKIKQLKDELRVIQAFHMYEAAQTDETYDEYVSTQIYYKKLYGTTLSKLTDERADEAQSTIIYLLPNYTESWTQTTDNSFNIDLSSFSGTKDFVVWVQLIKQDGSKAYDAEVFEVTGTRQDTTNNNGNNGANNSGNSGTNNNGSSNNGTSTDGKNDGKDNNGTSTDGKNDGKDNNGTSTDGKNDGKDNNGTSTDGKSDGKDKNGTSTDGKNTDKDTSTKSSSSTGDKTTASSKLPYAGVAKGTTIVTIVVAMVGAIISYVKYRKLK